MCIIYQFYIFETTLFISIKNVGTGYLYWSRYRLLKYKNKHRIVVNFVVLVGFVSKYDALFFKLILRNSISLSQKQFNRLIDIEIISSSKKQRKRGVIKHVVTTNFNCMIYDLNALKAYNFLLIVVYVRMINFLQKKYYAMTY